MPTSADPLAAYTIAATLLDCAAARLADTPLGEPARACVISGGIAWDDCQCGQLTVAITGQYPSAAFPSPGDSTAATFSQSRCGLPILAISYEATILRCMPNADEAGNAPPCADLDAAAASASADAFAVRAGITCCLIDMARARDARNTPVITDFVIRAQNFLGPAGACGGSALGFVVGILNACYC